MFAEYFLMRHVYNSDPELHAGKGEKGPPQGK